MIGNVQCIYEGIPRNRSYDFYGSFPAGENLLYISKFIRFSQAPFTDNAIAEYTCAAIIIYDLQQNTEEKERTKDIFSGHQHQSKCTKMLPITANEWTEAATTTTTKTLQNDLNKFVWNENYCIYEISFTGRVAWEDWGKAKMNLFYILDIWSSISRNSCFVVVVAFNRSKICIYIHYK